MILQAVQWLNQHALDNVGLWRDGGDTDAVDKLRDEFQNGRHVDFLVDEPANNVTGLVIRWLLQVPGKLLGPETTNNLIQAAQLEATERPGAMWRALRQVDQHSKTVLGSLLDHWHRVCDHSSNNRMNPRNVAIVVFGAVGKFEQAASMTKMLPAIELLIQMGSSAVACTLEEAEAAADSVVEQPLYSPRAPGLSVLREWFAILTKGQLGLRIEVWRMATIKAAEEAEGLDLATSVADTTVGTPRQAMQATENDSPIHPAWSAAAAYDSPGNSGGGFGGSMLDRALSAGLSIDEAGAGNNADSLVGAVVDPIDAAFEAKYGGSDSGSDGGGGFGGGFGGSLLDRALGAGPTVDESEVNDSGSDGGGGFGGGFGGSLLDRALGAGPTVDESELNDSGSDGGGGGFGGSLLDRALGEDAPDDAAPAAAAVPPVKKSCGFDPKAAMEQRRLAKQRKMEEDAATEAPTVDPMDSAFETQYGEDESAGGFGGGSLLDRALGTRVEIDGSDQDDDAKSDCSDDSKISL